ncbi:hypothetical protein IKG02_03180 [Candidatus Saccharibacteria bacterium]|nr:hypothetical protein [Candidatus Saccharibacteria bacterium]
MNNLKKHVLLAVFFGLFVSLFSSINVFATEETPSLGLSISPGVKRLELDPGAKYDGNVTIHNPTSQTLNLHMSAAPYSVDDISYAPVYSVKNAYTQISNWISFEEEDLTIEPSNYLVVNYTINVPEDAPGGGQYAVIFADVQKPDNPDSVQVSATAGMVVIAKVSGETRLTGEITNLSIPKFLFAPPVNASATFENTGNVDSDAKMSIKIENYFSGEVIYNGTSDPQEKTVLPGTTRELSISWSNVPRLGVLKVTLNTEFLDEAKVSPRIVIICPIWFIAIICLIILAIIARIISAKRNNRRTRSNSRSAQGGSENFNI